MSLCVICGEKEATDRCGPLPERRFCRPCHADKRIAEPCECMTIMVALQNSSNSAGRVLAKAKELGLETNKEESNTKKGEEKETMGARKKTAVADEIARIKSENAKNGAHALPKTGSSKPVERGRYQEMLPCKISSEDIERNSAELAKVIVEREAMLVRKREVNAAFREKVAFFDERLLELAESVKGGTEKRSVEVVEWLLPTNEVQIVRSDTGEVVTVRTATAEDLQESFPDIEIQAPLDFDERENAEP